jgi:hypothetical protein
MSHNTIIQMEIKKHMYSQTCVNDHLLTTTTCQQRRALTPSPGKKKHFKIIHQPLSNNYLFDNDILFGGPKGVCCTQF